jgi:hypothetical protein
MFKTSLALALLATATVAAPAAHADAAQVQCHLRFSLKGWSVLYKHAEGQGTVRCDNGQTAAVRLTINGGGLTAGKWRIDDGHGDISHVRRLQDVFGHYATANADAGVVKSAGAQVLTKGEVSLALHGTGEGINLGVDVGALTIEPVR